MTIGRDKERESVRQCFLFSNHLILTSRTQGGKLHLVENVGKIPLADITLIEDPNEETERIEEQGGKNELLLDYTKKKVFYLFHELLTIVIQFQDLFFKYVFLNIFVFVKR